jgi:hypothetical protein
MALLKWPSRLVTVCNRLPLKVQLGDEPGGHCELLFLDNQKAGPDTLKGVIKVSWAEFMTAGIAFGDDELKAHECVNLHKCLLFSLGIQPSG